MYTVYSMQQRKVSKDNISETVASELRNRIVDGRLAPGVRINEVHLAEQLGVSRTPLREALARLSHEGALDVTPRIGYFVRPLTLEEFCQIYPIRALLDPEALRLAGLPSAARLKELRTLNDRIKAARRPDDVIDLDDLWHLRLIGDCPNRVLLDLIQQFIQRTRRYELALMREQKNVSAACDRHRAILAALGRRDLEGACQALRSNLESGFEPIASWLTATEAATSIVS